MTIQSLISELHTLGYSLSLDGGQIRYKCLSLIEPPKDRVIPLLDTLKRNRETVIGYLKTKGSPIIPYDTLKTLYLEAFNRVGWEIGLMARQGVKTIEDKLNDIWLECMEGRATIEDFEATLKEWEGIIPKAMRKES